MSNTRKTKPAADVTKLLAAARLPERTVELCLRGDLQAQREVLQQDITEAKAAAKSAGSLGGTPEVGELEAALDALEVEMRDAVLTITLRALNPAEVTLLQVEHPPSDEDKTKGLAVNWETYRVARIRASIVDPALTDAQWERLLEVITLGQRTLLEDTVEVLNHSVVDVPFSSAASRRIQPSDGS
jgi:hypothetical protein